MIVAWSLTGEDVDDRDEVDNDDVVVATETHTHTRTQSSHKVSAKVCDSMGNTVSE